MKGAALAALFIFRHSAKAGTFESGNLRKREEPSKAGTSPSAF